MKNLIPIVLFLFPFTLKAEESPVFNVPGLFSVKSPEKGYIWKKTQDVDIGKIKAHYFSCTKEGSETRIIFIVRKQDGGMEDTRRVTLKANCNGLYSGLRDKYFAFLDMKRPPILSPIADRVSYYMKVKSPDGKIIFLRETTIFGQNIYTFQIFGPGEYETDKLLNAVVKSFQETPSKEKKKVLEGKSIEDPGLFSIQAPADGYIWKKQGTGDYRDIKSHGYICTCKDKKTILFLRVIEAKAPMDQFKREIASSLFEANSSNLEDSKYKILDSQAPVFEIPIPDQLECSLKTESSQGDVSLHHYTFIFKNLTYTFEASGPEDENPKSLLNKTIQTLKEIKK